MHAASYDRVVIFWLEKISDRQAKTQFTEIETYGGVGYLITNLFPGWFIFFINFPRFSCFQFQGLQPRGGRSWWTGVCTLCFCYWCWWWCYIRNWRGGAHECKIKYSSYRVFSQMAEVEDLLFNHIGAASSHQTTTPPTFSPHTYIPLFCSHILFHITS